MQSSISPTELLFEMKQCDFGSGQKDVFWSVFGTQEKSKAHLASGKIENFSEVVGEEGIEPSLQKGTRF